MQARGIPTDFGFLGNVAGFDINQSLIPYSAASTYGRAFLVGLLNTCLVGALGLVFATIIGFSVGLARLSKNWIVARCAMAYVEALRNVPLLLQLLFWYNAVLKPLPAPRQSFELPFGVFLNNRGLFAPQPVLQPGALWVGVAALVSILAAIGCAGSPSSANSRARAQRFSAASPRPSSSCCRSPLSSERAIPSLSCGPSCRASTLRGGVRLLPEFVALVLGLSLYTAAFIAEIVRAGVKAVPRGQTRGGGGAGPHACRRRRASSSGRRRCASSSRC